MKTNSSPVVIDNDVNEVQYFTWTDITEADTLIIFVHGANTLFSQKYISP